MKNKIQHKNYLLKLKIFTNKDNSFISNYFLKNTFANSNHTNFAKVFCYCLLEFLEKENNQALIHVLNKVRTSIYNEKNPNYNDLKIFKNYINTKDYMISIIFEQFYLYKITNHNNRNFNYYDFEVFICVAKNITDSQTINILFMNNQTKLNFIEKLFEYDCLMNSFNSYVDNSIYNEIKSRKKPTNKNDWFYFIMYLLDEIELDIFIKIEDKYTVNLPIFNYKNCSLFNNFYFSDLNELINELINSDNYYWYFVKNYIYDLVKG